MKKKILTLEQLYSNFADKNSICQFSANKEDGGVFVSVPATLLFEEELEQNEQSNDLETGNPFHKKVYFKICHTGENLKKTSFTKKVITDAISSLFNTPILGYIHEFSDGSLDFAGHEYLEDKDTGEVLEYYEVPVGVFPESCSPVFKKDEDTEREYLCATGYIYDKYSPAYSILQKKKQSKVSMEIEVEEMSYNLNTKILSIDKFVFTGVTILGRDVETEQEIQSGMTNATVEIPQGNKNTNNTNVDVNKENFSKGGEKMKLEELLQKYNVKVEDLKFSFDNLSEEGLEKKFAEQFSKQDSYSLVFDLSFDDIRTKLYEALKNRGEASFWIEAVYADYFIVQNYANDYYYKYGYKVDKEADSVEIEPNKTEVFAQYLTQEEKMAIQELRATKELLEEQVSGLKQIETQMKDVAIAKSEDYSLIAETDEFKELVSNIANYSLTEAQTKADLLLAKYMKDNKNKAATGQKSVNKINFNFDDETVKKGAYGSLF